MSDTDGGTKWEVGEAGKGIIEARRAGDVEAEVQALIRFSDGLRNISVESVGKVVIPLDHKIDALSRYVTDLTAQYRDLDRGDQFRAGQLYKQFGDFLKDADARFTGFDEAIRGHGAILLAVQEAVRSLGGIRAQVDDHETRITAIESHGAPAKAVDEIHQLRDELQVVRGEVNEVRSVLVLTRRQLWLTWVPIAVFVALIVITIMVRGWQ